MDVKRLLQMLNEDHRRYLFVAIERATRWVFVAAPSHRTAAAAYCLKAVHQACPVRIAKLLTDNGKELTDRLFGCKDRQATGEHAFDQLCQALSVEHRLIKPRTPKTNGMVKRFNGRIAKVLATHRFYRAQDLKTTLQRYVWLYNHHLP